LKHGGSRIHLHTNSTQNTEDGTHITITRREKIFAKEKIITRKKLVRKLGSAGSAPSCELYPGICLTTEVKARKPLS
jgi:hypothetical protein